MCDNISREEKAQPVPGLEEFRFYFTDPENLPTEWRNRALHPALEGLCVMAPRGKKQYRGVETAVKACNMKPTKGNEIAKAFYEDHIGINLRLKREHPLVGKVSVGGGGRLWISCLYQKKEDTHTYTQVPINVECSSPSFVSSGLRSRVV
jgi:hypothetical protein